MSKLSFILFLPFLFVLLVSGQTVISQTCDPPVVTISKNSEIIFTPEQEMYLGDIILDKVRNDYGVIDDTSVTGYLQTIANRLAKHLPNNGITFRIFISDQPETNASTLPGGVILIRRKMIAFTRTEDELAFILGHEMGHATVRHGAITFSRLFKRVLNADKFRDRNDIAEKYNQLVDRWKTKLVSADDVNEEQDEADSLGIYAMAAAGYDAGQIAPLWERLTKAKNKSSLAMFFGGGSNSEKRLKEILSQYKDLPTACRDQHPSERSEQFQQWRSRVLSFDSFAKFESVPGLVERTTLAPIRSEIESIRFSADGKYLITQDNSAVTVLAREPLGVVLEAPANDALPAQFSADSSSIIIVTKGLHLQKWNLKDRRITDDIEIALPVGYWQTKVSPNGDLIAVYETNGDLSIYDVKTGDVKFRQKEFYLPRYSEYFAWALTRERNDIYEVTALSMKFSPDGSYLLAGREDAGTFNSQSIVIDLKAGKAISIGDNVKRLIKNSYAFLSPNRMIGRIGSDMADSGIFLFRRERGLTGSSLAASPLTKPPRAI